MKTSLFTDEMPLRELVKNPKAVLGSAATQNTLHFCSPAHGGWGVIRIALMVNEAHLLFVCPSACGRHNAISAIEQGLRRRVTYWCVNNDEIVLGGYEHEIEQGVRAVMARINPKALIIFVSCLDDLLGVDHTASLKELEREFGIPIVLSRMNPIMMDGKLPPVIGMHKTVYAFLPQSAKKDRGILLPGTYRPPAQDSELGTFLHYHGFAPLRHPEYCADFAEFQAMSRSAGALVLRPEGREAALDLEKRLGMPCHSPWIAFDAETILARYRQLSKFLAGLDSGRTPLEGEALEQYFAPARARLEEKARRLRERIGDARIALDSTVTAAPFSLALALIHAGFNVTRIYTSQIPGFEKEHLARLAEEAGHILTANPNHARKYGVRPSPPLADIALGFEAAYAVSAPQVVPIAFDEQLYGFEGFARIVDAIFQAASPENPSEQGDLRKQLQEYGLVV